LTTSKFKTSACQRVQLKWKGIKESEKMFANHVSES
jgi:hypothetical protein